MADYRRQLGTCAVLSLVLLRLTIGWHFFSEGTEKLKYDARTGGLRVDFSAAPFLAQAKGPLAGVYRWLMPDVHGWLKLLAVPQQNQPLAADVAAQRVQWQADYDLRRTTAEKNKQPKPIEFPEFAPYHDWAVQIVGDWQETLSRFVAVPGISEDERRQAAEALEARKQQLADYLAGESEAINEYQHQLWRLQNWRSMPEAKGVPFQDQRIAAKTAETASQPKAWISQQEKFDQDFVAHLREILTPEQRANPETATAVRNALTSPQQARLEWVNLAAAVLTVGVGVCLLLGFFTRLASLAGALFLLGVIASQPPWVAGAESTIYQTVEFTGLLVLAGTRAGRWLGLDYFAYALFGRRRRNDDDYDDDDDDYDD